MTNVPFRPGMTLMPGQTTTVSIPIPAEIAERMVPSGHFVEVPPPTKAPVQDIAETLGVCDGLRAERSRHGQWRCACCHEMQRGDSWQIWVPDSVQRRDPAWSITEAARQNAYNGHFSAWCLSCAPKAPKKKAALALLPAQPTDPTNYYFPLAFVVAMGAVALLAIAAMWHT